MFNDWFKYFHENELILSNQACFKPNNYCVNQLVSITHEIYKSCYEGHNVTVFSLTS